MTGRRRADVRAAASPWIEGSRWAGAGGLAFAAHALLALAVLYRLPVEMPSEPPAAMLIELEPISAQPAVPSAEPPAPAEMAPPPEPAPEIAPEPEPEPEPLPEPLPVAQPEADTDALTVVARLPRARPDVVPELARPREVPPILRPKPRASAPAAAPRVARADAAPSRGASASNPSPSPDRWRNAVFRHLERHKRYPRGAQASGVGGTARVRFTIDANGNISNRRITASSGHPELDEAVLAMVARASPLPAPPPEIYRPGLSLEVPIRFSPR